MMISSTPEELADRVEKARLLLEQIAKCLNELEELAPGSTYASNGEIGGLGATVRGRMGGPWEVRGGRT
jgi:hypothetical protein